MEKPAQKDLKIFIEAFNKLCKFEATERVVNGKGCFTDKDIPVKEMKKVMDWINYLVSKSEKDVVDSLIRKYEDRLDEVSCKFASAQGSNDFIMCNNLSDEVSVYEDILEDLKNIGGLRTLNK